MTGTLIPDDALSLIHIFYDKQKEAVEEWAKETRSLLVVGDTCPVCGQEIKSLCKDEDFQSVLAPIRTLSLIHISSLSTSR